MAKIQINNDLFDDVGKVYKVISYERQADSTAVRLELEHNGEKINRVVAYHQIEFLEES